MYVTIGRSQEFRTEKYDSKFNSPTIESYFCDELANLYKPIIFGGDFSIPEPTGIFYRILCKRNQGGKLCIQYYVYWLEQDCLGLLPIADHKYDYEPILIYIESPEEFPVGIVNAGYSRSLGISCRFHKTEIRMKEFDSRDFSEYEYKYKTSPEPYYPFGGDKGVAGTTCIKKYPIAGAVYMCRLHPMFGIASCSHVFSGAEKDLHGRVLPIPLKRLDDPILYEWYFEHYKDEREEPFGHDVSNAFDFPYVKYCNPKPYLRSNSI